MKNKWTSIGFQASTLGYIIENVKNVYTNRLNDRNSNHIMMSICGSMIRSELGNILSRVILSDGVDAIAISAEALDQDLFRVFINTKMKTIIELLRPIWYSLRHQWIAITDLLHMIGEQLIQLQGLQVVNISILASASKNNTIVYCPGISSSKLVNALIDLEDCPKIDSVKDVEKLCMSTIRARESDKKLVVLIFGGGIAKHHIMNSQIFANGADIAIYVNNGMDYDGSDSGGNTEEAKSWGKINSDGIALKLWGDVSIVLPILYLEAIKNYVDEKLKSNLELCQVVTS